jgi:hypothetical protein
MTNHHRPFLRLRISVGVVVVAGALVLLGCGPDHAGSITVGDPAVWRKPPVAPSKQAPTSKVRTNTQGGDPQVYKSIKEQAREATQKP